MSIKSKISIKQAEDIPFWQWQKETPVAILEENELPTWKNACQVVTAVKAMGADLVRYPAIRWGVHSFDSSEYLPKYPGLGDRDLFGEIFTAMKKQNIKVMAYCHYGVLHTAVKETHPEWFGRESDGRLARWNGDDHHYRACICNDDFTFAMRKAIGELCDKYAIDSLYLDGPTWYGDCYCDHCRAKYLERYNQEMPDCLSFVDNSQQNYNKLRDEHAEKVLRELREELSDYPKLPILFNMTMRYLPTHRSGIPEKTVHWAEGGNTTEIHRPGSFWNIYQSIRLGESLEKISMGYLPPGPYETLRNFPAVELEMLASAYLMHGATPMLGTVSTFLNDTSAGKMMTQQVEKIKARPEIYYRSKPVKEIGLIYSRTSAENHAGYKREMINNHFSGAFRALLNEHIHFDTFFDTQIDADKLEAYRAVFIPGGVSLSSVALDKLRNYVKNGGNLLATGNFTLIDESGVRLENFSASDLLGVDFKADKPVAPYRGREYRETGTTHGYSMIPEAYLKLNDSRLLNELDGNSNLTPVSDAQVGLPGLKRKIEYSIVEAAQNTKVLADLYLPAGGAFGESLHFPLGTPPGITLNHYGQGKVIYVATPLEEYYLSRRLPETRGLLGKLFEILLDDFVVHVEAPPGIIINLTTNGKEYFLHLLNYCGTMNEDGCAVEYIAPVRNIKVKLGGKLVSKNNLHALYSDIDLQKNNSGAHFVLPELKTFETIIIRS
jgi:putative glycosyl hydrolase-like family 6 (GHL6) protein